ncbi:hypothetical protein B0H11DRAFT_1943975 [Mycena galericulata]|nr:hypothetical protein B0H11DRAFT_1943975 [Mycena galericulata]
MPKSDHKLMAEIELERLEARLRMVQLTLESLTDDEDGDEGRPISVLRLSSQLNSPDIEGAEDETPDVGMAQALPALVGPTTLSFPLLAALSPHPSTMSALHAIHLATLEGLNPIFLALERGGMCQACEVMRELASGSRICLVLTHIMQSRV